MKKTPASATSSADLGLPTCRFRLPGSRDGPNASCSLVERTAAVAHRFVRASFNAGQFQVSERFEGSRHHMEHRAIVRPENLIRHLERALRLALDQVEHLRFAIAMMLDELIGAMAMVAVNAAMRWQHQLYVEILHL